MGVFGGNSKDSPDFSDAGKAPEAGWYYDVPISFGVTPDGEAAIVASRKAIRRASKKPSRNASEKKGKGK